MRLFVAAVVAVLSVTVATRQIGSVPGCPDLDVLEAEVDTSADFLNNLLLCFCKVHDKDKVYISCLYGSSPEHLDKATEAVKKANFTTTKISFQHIEFADSGLPSFGKLAPALESLEIRECTNVEPLIVPEEAFKGLESTLKNLTIDSCSLKEIPAAINDLKLLETLVLANNKIEHVHAPRLSNKKELNYLDLSGNFITTVDAGSFEPLKKLETLIFGERNYINDSVVDAIVTLKSLRTLDLSRADGIFEPPTEVFDSLEHLEVLKLSGCSVSSLEPGVFAALKNLKEKLHRKSGRETLRVLQAIRLGPLSGIICSDEVLTVDFVQNSQNQLDNYYAQLGGISEDNEWKPEDRSWLDLRVNLIQNVSAYAFDGLSQLTRLSLAGNYIRKFEKEMWTGLDSLKEVDLGWNEITELSPDAFSPLSNNLMTLNLRHNPLKTVPPTGLKNLRALFLSECPLENIGHELLKDYPTLETLDVAKCNLTQLTPDTFVSQKHSLKSLHLQRNLLKTLDPKIIEDLESLERLDISGNPFLCDSGIAKLIFAVEDRYKVAAKEGKEFLFENANDTLCDRPYTLRHQPLLDVDTNELQPYDEKLDTTTPLMTSTTESRVTAAEETTPFTLPDLFVGAKTNDTLFKEEPRREVYDLNKANDPKNAMEQQNDNKSFAVTVTVVVIAIISLIAVLAVMLFMRKKRKIASAEAGRSRKKTSRLEDGMVEIELDSSGPTKK